MVARASGALRWGRGERELVQKYLDAGRIDFTRLDDVEYLRGIQSKEDLWKRHPPRNFYQNIRRACSVWQVNNNLEGARRTSAAGRSHGRGRGGRPPVSFGRTSRHPPATAPSSEEYFDEEVDEDEDGNEEDVEEDDAPSPAPTSESSLLHSLFV